MTEFAEQQQTLIRWIEECPKDKMVFFGGAGVSTESGIPDFRSADGLFAQQYDYPPETMVSHSFFAGHPEEFFNFYFDRMVPESAQPNQAHKKLAELEKQGILSAVITQNVDGLHQAAGSKNVIELHGSIHRNFCTMCQKTYNLEEMLALREQALAPVPASGVYCTPEGCFHRDGTPIAKDEGMPTEPGDGIPVCSCGGVVRPDVVLYEEPLNEGVMTRAIEAISSAELMVVAGTSLVVYPAAGLLQFFHGKHLAIINLVPTSADRSANLCIAAKVGEVFSF